VTAFFGAVSSSSFAAIKLFLQRDDVLDFINEPDDQGTTPLMEAAKKHMVLIVDLLIQCGANAKLKKKDGSTALHEVYRYAPFLVIYIKKK